MTSQSHIDEFDSFISVKLAILEKEVMKKGKPAKKPLMVGITGGIGSGKTTVCRVFEWLKIPVYYADQAAQLLIKKDKKVKAEIISLLGKKAYLSNGDYNTEFVGGAVFNDQSLLTQLNQIVHPAVAKNYLEWQKTHSKKPYIMKEAAILFESGSYRECDKIICVIAPEELKIARVMKRNGISRKEVKQRMRNQFSDEEKIKRSNYVIKNDEQQLLVPQVMKVHDLLLKAASRR